jgi:hypothetical protein
MGGVEGLAGEGDFRFSIFRLLIKEIHHEGRKEKNKNEKRKRISH